MKESEPTFFVQKVLPLLQRNGIVHFLGFGNRLGFDPMPSSLQVPRIPKKHLHGINWSCIKASYLNASWVLWALSYYVTLHQLLLENVSGLLSTVHGRRWASSEHKPSKADWLYVILKDKAHQVWMLLFFFRNVLQDDVCLLVSWQIYIVTVNTTADCRTSACVRGNDELGAFGMTAFLGCVCRFCAGFRVGVNNELEWIMFSSSDKWM